MDNGIDRVSVISKSNKIEILKSLGIYKDIQNKKIKCSICDRVISVYTLDRILIGSNSVDFACSLCEFNDDVVIRFNELADKWQEQTCFHSNVDKITSNENYQEIIKMGMDAVPLILDRMRIDGNGLWSCALIKIIGKSPLKWHHKNKGNIKAICDSWIAWGERNGY